MSHLESGKELGRTSMIGHRRDREKLQRGLTLMATLLLAACAGGPPNGGMLEEGPDGMPIRGDRKVRPGITVLLDDSIKLVAGKRVALITNHTGVDEKERRTIDLLATDPRAARAGVKLVRLFAPEHGAKGTADTPNLADDRDEKTGLVVHSLYQRATIAPPDSLLTDVDVIVVDLQDIGTRTWTYVGVMLYAMKAGERRGIPVLVLDRPNPITGSRAEGALLDSSLANPNEPAPGKPSNGFALAPMPLRHGLTMGELAKYFQGELKLATKLTVVPMRNWRRQMWFDQTSLPWIKPSPNMPNVTTAVMYPALVPFESSNVSVGRGTNEPFQRFGAPWMRADSLAKLLEDLSLSGVRFRADRFTPNAPGDNKYAGQAIPGVRIEVTDREIVQPARIGAAILWALSRVHRDSLRLTPKGFDERIGSSRVREAILGGADPDAVIDRQLAAVVDFARDARRYHLYR